MDQNHPRALIRTGPAQICHSFPTSCAQRQPRQSLTTDHPRCRRLGALYWGCTGQRPQAPCTTSFGSSRPVRVAPLTPPLTLCSIGRASDPCTPSAAGALVNTTFCKVLPGERDGKRWTLCMPHPGVFSTRLPSLEAVGATALFLLVEVTKGIYEPHQL
jgi:hypothetical protein